MKRPNKSNLLKSKQAEYFSLLQAYNKDLEAYIDYLEGKTTKPKKVPKKDKEWSKEVNNTYDIVIDFFPPGARPKTESSLNKWKDTIDKLNRIEKLPFDYIIQITEATRKDPFWSKNFLSMAKLRDKNRNGVMYVVVFHELLQNYKAKQQTQVNNIKQNLNGW